ncbi:vWA domain-containing protein [Teredinibacter purpureus]|uniref:vWA domain-containing protein n=1 Tax=Teredinibacter purpureus TaxID=2731756 RepID=UPI0013C46C2E|nr:vWA domain-containing protein [Teredinibacter purpureus]
MKRLLRYRCLAGTLLGLSTLALASTDGTDPAVNHTVSRSVSAVFTADGVNTLNEYNDADHMVEALGSDYLEAKVYSKRYFDAATGNEELRVYFSVHDIDANADDRISFYFDRLHNHGTANADEAQEDTALRITRADCVALACNFTRINRSGGVFAGAGSPLALSNAHIIAANPGEYAGAEVGFQLGWSGEFVLTPADFGWSYFPQTLGLLVEARSENANAISSSNPLPGAPATSTATYPLNGANTVSANAPLMWGNMHMRYPIDYAVIMDNSGSMLQTDGGVDNRWVQAKRAADLFVTTLGLFKTDMLDDQVSISQYSWSCSDETVSGNTTGAVSGLGGKLSPGDVPPPPTSGSYTDANAANPGSNNCTPIKAGIEFALEDQLGIAGASPNDKRDRIAILLSDGLHNQPNSDVPFDPNTDFSVDEKNFTQIRTVALGNDGVADTALLADISTAFNGGAAYSHEARFNQTNSFSDLLMAYLETLQAPLTINQVPKIGANYNPGAPDKLVFIGVWDTPANATDLTLELNGNPASAADYDSLASYVNTDIGYAALVLNNPAENGVWQLVSSGALQDNEFVLADLRILARFLTQQKKYFAGDDILLQVSLLDNGEPILGANVSVEAAVPGEGLGNYLSTVGDNCEATTPNIPSFANGDDNSQFLASVKKHNQSWTRRISQAVAAQSGSAAEPKVGRFALSSYHFGRCQKEGLTRNALPGMPLVDDGTQGDKIAGDGIYSLAFNNTGLEGSYNFRYFALGTTTDGVEFGRMRVSSQYVGVAPTAGDTPFQIMVGPMLADRASQLLYFLPKDSQGNYVGPGLAHTFAVEVEGGYPYGELLDLNNGYYLQIATYAPNAQPPVVSISTNNGFDLTVGNGHTAGTGNPDCETNASGVAQADEHTPLVKQLWAIIVALVVLCLILLMLLIFCRLRKR